MSKKNIILIVDDDEETRKLMKFALAREGYEIRTADSGVSALKLLERLRPILIIVDMVMPGMDGYTFMGKIKKIPILRHIPVIVSSAKSGMKEFFELEEETLKPDAYIVKPYKIKDLVNTVRDVI